MLPPLLLLSLALLVALPRAVEGAHANFHVHYPWLTRAPNPRARPEIRRYQPFCGYIIHNPQRFARLSETFLSFSAHPGDLVSARYSRSRVPRGVDDFAHQVMEETAVGGTGQLCVPVQLGLSGLETQEGEVGVFLFQARDPQTGSVQHWCSDVKMTDIDVLAEGHPAMCARGNGTLIPMPDEYL